MPTATKFPGFKAIIIGAGPTGLSAAHALSLAGVDFVVLERRGQIAKDQGASLVLAPGSMRVMQQFGLLEALDEAGCDVVRSVAFTREGEVMGRTETQLVVKECHGTCPISYHRADLIRILYEGLPAESKSKILLGQQITDIQHVHGRPDNNSDHGGGDGVRVTCADGTVHTGSIIIGADGVNSLARKTMRRLVLDGAVGGPFDKNGKSGKPTKASGPVWEDPEDPFESTYRCLWATFPNPDGKTGVNCNSHDVGRSTMYISGTDRAWLFLYEELPEKTNSPGVKYTEEEIRTAAEEFGEYFITEGDDVTGTRAEGLRVKDAMARATRMGMTNIAEGVVKHWSLGRIVLVGDACHKFTPNAGQGFNTGLQDVVVLCNLLKKALVQHHRDHPQQTTTKTTTVAPPQLPMATLAALFRQYHDARQEETASMLELSATYTRMQAMAGFWWRLLGWVTLTPWVQSFMVRKVVGPRTAKSAILSYVPFKDKYVGSLPWAMTCSDEGSE
ncbi:uncharacterized protein B0I36DRAFT_375924 [Microdochium trichocladiopsis]|uniref:FAD-binding domain-containing protein n=1 Tax=Microdochium trichocladiopsis TaxID=1682393 RepID=A0A9P8XYF3_9PEZI|nr:uncharacterized protein B0I36DRAFT_375924 [Microdochium trichocladiopsis]KAH7025980.1 hypothetical protein B0I36DRAFT_375924 [Microdochium trichocladiopsis]